MDRSLEGWFTDPFAVHEARWMSEGAPTALVRDGEVESKDPAPDGPLRVTPERLGDDPAPNYGADLQRADDAEREPAYESKEARRLAMDEIVDQGPIF